MLAPFLPLLRRGNGTRETAAILRRRRPYQGDGAELPRDRGGSLAERRRNDAAPIGDPRIGVPYRAHHPDNPLTMIENRRGKRIYSRNQHTMRLRKLPRADAVEQRAEFLFGGNGCSTWFPAL